MRDGWTVGPTSSESLRETPVEDLTEASNTTLSVVVVLSSFRTACMGSKRFPVVASSGLRQAQARRV